MAKQPAKMTRTELQRKVRQLEGQSEEELAQRLKAELEVWREESRQQTEHLLETQRQLEESHQRYAHLYDQAPIAYLTHDYNGSIEEANASAARLLGYEPSALRGRPLLVFIAQPGRKSFLDHMLRCRRGDPQASAEVSIQPRSGEALPVQLVTRTARRPEGGECFHTVLIDLTERHRAETERREAILKQEAAQAASEAKDHFLAILSHELRTPLTPVVAAVSSLERHPALPEDVRNLVDVMRRNLRMEIALIDDLLDVTRIVRGKLTLRQETVDLNALIGEVLRTCEPEARKKDLHLQPQLDAGEHFVRGDSIRLQQVLWNLVRNAVKFTPDAGRIIIRTRNESGAEGSPVILIDVVDSGAGIDPQFLPQLFRPFEQAVAMAGRRGGLGLGLSIARGLVQSHHGDIWAHSDGAGKGATFSIRLPSVPAPAPASAPKPAGRPAPESEPAAQVLHILLVEDHADTARMMSQLLRSEGHKVRIADSVAAARAQADGPFDLVISDIGLPDGTGYDVIREIHARRPVPGIALSGFGTEADVARAREAGFDQHITKPVDFHRLLAAIDQLARPA